MKLFRVELGLRHALGSHDVPPFFIAGEGKDVDDANANANAAVKFLIKSIAECGGDWRTITTKAAPEPNLDFIDTLRRDACDALGERVLTRMRQIRIEDPVVYSLACTRGGQTWFLTCKPGFGTRQLLAADSQHRYLWLCSCRKHAESYRKYFEKEGIESGEFWQVIEIPKSDAVKLPCYQRGELGERYLDNEEMVFEGGYDHRIPKCWRKNSTGEWVQDVPVREGMDVWLPHTSLTPKELSQLAGAPVPHRAIVRCTNGSYEVAVIRTGIKPITRWSVDDAYASREDARLAAQEVTDES